MGSFQLYEVEAKLDEMLGALTQEGLEGWAFTQTVSAQLGRVRNEIDRRSMRNSEYRR